jgi:tape measure domain-containing protein
VSSQALEILLRARDETDAAFKRLQDEIEKTAEGTKKGGQETKRWTEEQQRAEMAMAALREEAMRLNREFDEKHGLAGRLRATGKSLEEIGGKMQSAGMALLPLSAAIAGLGGAALVSAGKFEQTRIAFETMLGSAEKADAYLAKLRDFAASTPFEFNDLTEAAKRLMALGFSADQVLPMLRTVGDAVAGLGGGAPMIDRVTLALGQMQAKGKVSAQEMNQLAESGIPAWELLAKKIGVSIPEAMAKAEAGAISSATAIPAILAGMNAKFGGMMEKQSQTLLGQWSNVVDKLSAIAVDLGTALMPVANDMIAAFQRALPVAEKLVAAFAAMPAPARNITIGFAALAAAAGPVLLALGTMSAGIGALIAAGPVLVPILGLLAGAALALGAAWVAGGQSIEGVITMFHNGIANMADAAALVVGAITHNFVTLFQVMGKIPGSVGEPFRAAAHAVQEFNFNLQNVGANTRTLGKNTAAEFGKIKAEVKKAVDQAKELASAFQNAGAGPGGSGAAGDKAAQKLGKLIEKANAAARKGAYGQGQGILAEITKQKQFELVETAKFEELKSKAMLAARKGAYQQLRQIEAEATKGALVELQNQAKKITIAANVGSSLKSALGQLGPTIMGALQGGGSVTKSVTSLFGGALGEGLQSGATKALGFLGKTLSSSLGAMLPGIGSALGALAGGLIGKLFGGDKYKKEVTQLRSDFIGAAGGLDELRKKAALAGVDLTKFLSNTRDVTKMKAEIQALTDAFNLQDQAQQELDAAVKKYGFTIAELGPKWAAQELDKQAAQLFKEYELLIGAGADMNAVIAKMGPAFNEYVQSVVSAGGTIPEALRPVIEKLIETGGLTDEAGNKITDIGQIQFGDTTSEFEKLTSGIKDLVDAIKRLVGAWDDAGSAEDRYRSRPRPKPPDPNVDIPEDEIPMARGGVVLPFVPRAANGLYAPAQPGGMLARIGEGGEPEIVTPVKNVLAMAERIATANGGGGGDIIIPVSIGGEKLDEIVLRRSRQGFMRVDAAGIRRRG